MGAASGRRVTDAVRVETGLGRRLRVVAGVRGQTISGLIYEIMAPALDELEKQHKIRYVVDPPAGTCPAK
jgi:hypothetical protein